MQSYDLIVIGSGPAGQRAAIQGAKFGKRVAVVERRECVGGACINTGTIPSKTLREAVMHLSGYAYQGIYGVNYRVKDKITMADLAFRVQHVIKTEIDVTQSQLTRNGVATLFGNASFKDPHTIRIDSLQGSTDFHAENIVIATGTKPAASPKVPYNNRNIINSDQILNMPEIPKTFIDRLETDGPEAVIARAILKFAESLGIPTVAEGVETPAALAVLRELGCPAYQGYLFARPLDEAKATEILSTGLAPRVPVATRKKRSVTLASVGKWRHASAPAWGWRQFKKVYDGFTGEWHQ